MNPLFFGASERPLFGIYHPSQRNRSPDAGVVLCPPYATEYMRSHWAYRQLANRLTRAGWHVLRFDYSGTGDSAGARGAFDTRIFHDDIRAAAEELRSTAGIKRVSMVGLRLGALLAATCENLELDALVLWDPVVSGQSYLDELGQLHLAMLKDLDRFSKPRPADTQNTQDQFLGFPFPENTCRSMASLSLKSGPQCRAERVFTLGNHDLSGSWKNPVNYRFERALEDGAWTTLEKIESALFAPQTISRIEALLGESGS